MLGTVGESVALFATADGGPKENSFERTEESSSGDPGIETPTGDFGSEIESRCELAGSSATEIFRVFFQSGSPASSGSSPYQERAAVLRYYIR